MNQKQLEHIQKFEEQIKVQVAKITNSGYRYRPDSIIFAKIAKKLLVWVQNAFPRSSIDESQEVQNLLEYLTHIVVSPFVLTEIFKITFNFKMLNCQLILVKGMFEQTSFGLLDKQVLEASLRINREHLLPEARTFVELIT